jgi:hypothetical protein
MFMCKYIIMGLGLFYGVGIFWEGREGGRGYGMGMVWWGFNGGGDFMYSFLLVE